MDILKIIQVLQNKINSSTTAQEVLYLSKSIESLNLGLVKTVATYTDLLSIYQRPAYDPALNKGEVYFVEDEEKLYYVFGSILIPIFKTADTELYGWGDNGNGRLGDNTTVNKSSPVPVVGGFTDWVQTSGSLGHSLGLRSNGTLWAWGGNSGGQLGDNTTVNKSSLVPVVGGFTDWVQVSAGRDHSIGLRDNRTLWAWGNNGSGRLGDNTTTNRSSPVSVVGGFTNWVQASAGGYHGLGVRSNGSLWAWGLNNVGQLGNNTALDRSSPVSVVGGFTNWIQASGGSLHSLGVRANGTLWAWGFNGQGRLGDNTTVAKSSPVSVVGGFTDWVQASAGTEHSLGVRANGTLWAWGNGIDGRLGDNTAVSRSSPVSVVGGFTNWVQASAGGTHSLGLRANGTLWSWGSNANGRLGDNTVISKNSPVSVVGGFTDWVQASATSNHSLGLRSK
jgi:alpha-tubulin suppressor-like RCC1 family protein